MSERTIWQYGLLNIYERGLTQSASFRCHHAESDSYTNSEFQTPRTEEIFDILGADGWEMITFDYRLNQGVFKRPVVVVEDSAGITTGSELPDMHEGNGDAE